MSATAPPPSSQPDIDCMTCSPSERYQRPNRGHIRITDDDTGQTIRSCGACLEAGIDNSHLVAETPATGTL